MPDREREEREGGSEEMDVPAAIPLANANINVPPAFGAILPDGVSIVAQVEQETQHLRGVKRGRDLGVVTTEEFGGRVARHHAIVAKHAGPGAAPAWAVPLIASIDMINANINMMNMRLLRIAAVSESTIARLLNQRLMGGDEALHTIHKMVVGIPAVAPAWASNAFIMPAFPIVPSVDDTPQVHNVHYPETVGAIYTLSRSQIAALAVFYNDSFGLAPGDIMLGIQRTAFARFVGR